eukprot:COSAG01_NODE_47_length_32024_cov_1294.553579_17_plen_273_part_00
MFPKMMLALSVPLLGWLAPLLRPSVCLCAWWPLCSLVLWPLPCDYGAYPCTGCSHRHLRPASGCPGNARGARHGGGGGESEGHQVRARSGSPLPVGGSGTEVFGLSDRRGSASWLSDRMGSSPPAQHGLCGRMDRWALSGLSRLSDDPGLGRARGLYAWPPFAARASPAFCSCSLRFAAFFSRLTRCLRRLVVLEAGAGPRRFFFGGAGVWLAIPVKGGGRGKRLARTYRSPSRSSSQSRTLLSRILLPVVSCTAVVIRVHYSRTPLGLCSY